MRNESQKDNSKIVLAIVLIVVGILWMLRKLGIHIQFPRLLWENIYYPLREVFHSIGHFVFSWPVLLILIGGVLMAGKRQIGLVFVIVGGLFLLPKFFIWPGLSLSFALPFILIGIGIAMIARKL